MFFLVAAGLLCIGCSVGHGYLGQTRLISPSTFPSRQAKSLVTLIWQFSAFTWASCGMVIAAAPLLFDRDTRATGVALACVPLCYGVVGNAWLTRGRHFGWKLFAGVIVLAVLGTLLPDEGFPA